MHTSHRPHLGAQKDRARPLAARQKLTAIVEAATRLVVELTRFTIVCGIETTRIFKFQNQIYKSSS